MNLEMSVKGRLVWRYELVKGNRTKMGMGISTGPSGFKMLGLRLRP